MMIGKIRWFATGLAVLAFLAAGVAGASAADVEGLQALDQFSLTTEQMERIGGKVDEYMAKEDQLILAIEGKLSELSAEMRREDRFETGRKEKRAAKNVNSLVKDISSLYGQLIKTKVEYILKIKNVLTVEQRMQLIHSLEFDEGYFEEALPAHVELDLLVDVLGLTNDQLRSILKNRTDMQIKALKIILDVQYKMIDLEEALLSDEVNTENVDSIILAITDLGTQLIDNKVKYQLKSKDTLTAEQKKKVLHLIMLKSWSAI